MIIITVPLGKLQVAELNVRKNREDAERTAALEASIMARGLIEPIIAHPLGNKKDGYAVYAGGRRLRALKNLQKRGAIAADYEAPVIVRDLPEGEIIEDSAMENIIRSPLRDYEVYAAYRDAQDRGISREDLAAHFGQRQIYVDQILRLGRLHPTIFKALADGKLSNDQARAYAATEDQALQIAIYDRLNGSNQHYPHYIRHAMKVGDGDAELLLRFVGRDRYEAAGGRWERDLFEEAEDRGRVVDEAILSRLVEEKLADLRTSTIARANREVAYSEKPPTTGGTFGYTDHALAIAPRRSPLSAEHKARREDLEQRKLDIEDLARRVLFDENGRQKPGTEQQRAELGRELEPIYAELEEIERSRRYLLPKAGEIVFTIEIDRDGEGDVKFWFASKKAKREAEKPAPAGATASADTDPGSMAADQLPAPIAAPPTAGLSQTGLIVLQEQRRTILRAMLIQDAEEDGTVAIDYLVWSQLRKAVFHADMSRTEDVGAFTVSAGHYDSLGISVEALPHLKEMPAYALWEEAIGLLKEQKFLQGDNMAGAFVEYQAADPAIKSIAAAVVTGLTLRRSLNGAAPKIPVHDVLANATRRSSPKSIRSLWAPTAAVLNMMPKANRLDLVASMIEGSTLAAWAKKKAGEITDLVLNVLRGKSPALRSDAVDEAGSWVHPLIAFGNPDLFDAPASADDREAA